MKKPFLGIVLVISVGLTSAAFAEENGSSRNADTVYSAGDAQLLLALNTTPKNVSIPATVQAGINYYNRGYIAKALPLFEKATQQIPQNEMAWLWLAKAHQKQGSSADFEKAKVAFQKVLNINPNNIEALSNLGEMWSWELNKRVEAIRLLKHAYEINPADVMNAKRLSEALFWQGNATEALQYAKPIANRYQADRKFMDEYAQMLSQSGQAEQALNIYNTVLKTESSKNVTTKLNLARTFLKDGQLDKAQGLYADIYHSVQGTALSKNGDFIQSMASLAFDLSLYSDTLQWDQQLPESMLRQRDIQLRDTRAYMHVGRTPEAIETFQRLYSAGLLGANEKLEYADYLRQLNVEESALPSPTLIMNLYQEAAQEAPENGEVAVRLARMYAEQESGFSAAVQSYQKALNSELINRDAAKREFLDFIKSDKTQPVMVEKLFQQMLIESPDDTSVKTAYAEFLSWQKERRAEALRLYLDLAKADPAQSELWEARIEEVLKWHQPTTTLIPLYQEIVNLYPQSQSIWLSVARAYRSDKNYYKEAIETYSIMVQRYPQDGTIKREWLSLLTSNDSQRGQNIKLLEKMSQENPGDLDIKATYGKLLSYDHKYGAAMAAFEDVLRQNVEHQDALVGKGYVILWSGRKFEAKNYFTDLRQKYPDNVDIALGLAQADKLIGRYDEAIKIIEEIRPLMQKNPSTGYLFDGTEVIPVAHWNTNNHLLADASYDFSILPYENGVETPVQTGHQAVPSTSAMTQSERPSVAPSLLTNGAAPSELKSLQSEVDALTDAVNSLKALQESSRRQLDSIGRTVQTTRDVANGETLLHSNERMAAGGSGLPTGKHSVGERGMTPAYGNYAAIDSDTNPLLSGMGRFKNDELSDVEKGLLNELRPMIRTGYVFSTQDGEDTTTGLNSWGFPNQVSFSLTPQMRLRAGLRPVKYYLPDGVNPNSTWGWEYGLGATVKYWDRLTLDSDLALTHYTQSKTENLTFQTQAAYAINDSITVKLGARRLPQYNSLLSIAGQRPSMGAFRNDLVGQARENTFYGELNTHPFSQNLDWNLGYEWGFVDGEHIPRNYKNQAFTSLGYTVHYATNHQMRFGYEFLYFGYGKNATNGYFDTTALGLNKPVVSLDPVIAANSGYSFGGYYSPKMFIMNAGRLDFRGSLFNKFLEYKLGGSLGAQTTRLGHHIDEDDGNGTRLAGAFDGNLIMNLTDWLAAYGSVDFLKAGQQFNRWRFGGGLILRPHIKGLSPLFGQPIDQKR